MPAKLSRTHKRPLDERLYQAGPRASWEGRCEVDDAGRMFVYHSAWPTRSAPWVAFAQPHSLAYLVDTGNWERVLDPALVVSEGL